MSDSYRTSDIKPEEPVLGRRLAESPAAQQEPQKGTMGLWRKNGIEGGKYLVLRRDGSVLEHPHFVLVARDPAAPRALMAYARQAELLGFDPTYVRNLRDLAPTWHEYREAHGAGDPDAKPHRKDDPDTVAKMARGGSA